MEHPGLLYVAATLLPLASFLILLIWGGLRNFARRNKATSPALDGVYQILGGDAITRTPAYIATAAIAGAFVLCLTGFILHAQDEHTHGAQPAAHAHDHKHDHDAAHADGKWAAHFEWIRLGSRENDSRGALALDLGFKIDHLATIMFLMVTFIATLIHIFSIGYMSDELQEKVEDHHVHTAHGHLERRGRFGRFFMYLSLFCFSMLNLILADNLFQVFISWELVGICSYLLIGFYYERTSASNAANKAFITNRVGDAGFVVGLLIIWTYVGTFNFDEIFARLRSPLHDSHGAVPLGGAFVRANPGAAEPDGRILKLAVPKPGEEAGSEVVLFPVDATEGHFHGVGHGRKFLRSEVRLSPDLDLDGHGHIPYWLLTVAGLGIFLGCVGKSAQFPLQVWLPDAMEGPTPVSALIHAATMVAAGVYLVGRAFPMFTREALLVIAYTGAITLFVAATIAIVMTDIKKVLAYSTVSQLGYMMLALGVGGWAAGLFHLLTHAFFKALLFLGSGSVIYGCHHEQEMTKMGGLLKKMPITGLTMLAGVLAIAGTPLFTGWYSKDAILVAAYGFTSVHGEHMLLFLAPLVTAGITTFYMFRMWFLTFTGEPRDAHVYEHAHETPWLMTVPLILLAVCSIGVAWGWPVWDAEASAMEKHVHHAQHHAVYTEFGTIVDKDFHEGALPEESIRQAGQAGHTLVGLLALFSAGMGFLFAFAVYKLKTLDPAEAKEQFAGAHDFLAHKWYFDELYSAMLVRPALAVSGWCRDFDRVVIDGFANGFGRFWVWVSKWDGLFDNGVIDGLANLLATMAYGVAGWFRSLQTGFLRSYVLFLVLAAIGLFVLLKYLVSVAVAG
jgi:NADH-quinone oxidoreductase subunit L